MGNIRRFFREIRKLKRAPRRQRQVLPFLLAFLIPFLFSQVLLAEDWGILLGRVTDDQDKPLARVQVTLTSKDALFRSSSLSDKDGFFGLNGIPPGEILIVWEHEGYRPYKQPGVIFEPAGVLFVKVGLKQTGSLDGSAFPAHWVDLSNSSSETIISKLQIDALPSAGNVWSLVENQDLSATTNRIDVGGMWASEPALFSSRGSVSWTQTSYLINGMEVTDPYLTGTPLFYPDLGSLAYTQHSNGQHPIRYLSPAGYFDLIPRQGTPNYQGAVSAIFSTKGMTTSNITPALEREGLPESNRLNSFQNYSAQASGPVLPGRLFFFTSFTRLDLSRDIAEFAPDDQASLTSGLINLNYFFPRSSLQVFWTGQLVRQPTFGAARNVPYSATLNRKNTFNVLQFIWRMRFRPDHFFQVGASLSQGNIHSDFQEGVEEPHGLEIFKEIPSGAAASAGRADRSALVLQGHGEALIGNLSRYHHRLEYGFSLQYLSSSSEEEILDNYHLHFFGESPLEIVRFDTPLKHKERAFNLQLCAGETLTFSNLASLAFGLNFIQTRGWVPPGKSERVSSGNGPGLSREGGKIAWTNLSPRLAFVLPFTAQKNTLLRISAARYYFQLPLWYLTYGNPNALGGLAYPWIDRNHDNRFQEGETGPLWRREAPYYASVDPNLKRPSTDEYAVALTHVFANNLYLTLAGFYRETRNLVETLNVGVPLSAYDPVEIFDSGDDYTPGTEDDRYLTVYNQNKETLGQDFFLLTNPDRATRISRYRGLDLTVVKKFSRTSVFFFSATATEAVGTTSPGNTEWENDDGVVGALYDNPNAFLFARGRLRFDRAYTARLGASLAVPLGFRLAALIKYYDGQPFARKIIITAMNQGPFYVQAFYRGKARYEFNMTVDVRLEKIINFGKATGRIFLDGYNIFNWAWATQENEWTGPEFTLRYATEIESPRVFRLGFAYEF
jgi:hypothetical protein